MSNYITYELKATLMMTGKSFADADIDAAQTQRRASWDCSASLEPAAALPADQAVAPRPQCACTLVALSAWL
jgi:hypothetical protein